MNAWERGTPWPAPAKLNLFLHVTARRSDGYHELQTLFQFLDFGDLIWFEPVSGDAIALDGNTAAVPPERDLVVRAAQLLAEAGGVRRGARIRIEKRLPLGAGLGGGSSDAATTLVALDYLWGLKLGTERLVQLALELGADVPVFVRGRASWAEGIGERLTPLEDLEESWYLVLHPAVSISTAAIFSDPRLTRDAPRIKIADFLAGGTTNQLEAVATRLYPEVGEALRWLAEYGPARMTGSGACVFSAFPERSQAEAVLAEIPAPWSGFVARGRNRSPLLERLQELQSSARSFGA